jgi:hypothetical protein
MAEGALGCSMLRISFVPRTVALCFREGPGGRCSFRLLREGETVCAPLPTCPPGRTPGPCGGRCQGLQVFRGPGEAND